MRNEIILQKMLMYTRKLSDYCADHEGVNLKLVWEIISEDIPELQKSLQELI